MKTKTDTRTHSARTALGLTSHQHASNGWFLAKGNFFLFQAARQGSEHAHRGSMRSSISNRNKQHQGGKWYQLRLQAGIHFFSLWESFKGINYSAIVKKIPMALASKLRMKKISDWLSDYSKFVRS